MIDFLCIGAQKAGTTWLMGNLSRHPGIWTPRFIKEIHYFDKVHLGFRRNMLSAYRNRCAKLVEQNPEFARYFEKVIDPDIAFTDPWYEHIFSAAPSHKKKGECTPLYCALNDEGVEHVHRLAPNAAIIYMIRDPFQRIMSSLRMEMGFRKISNSSDMTRHIEHPLFVERGRYSANIPRWESVFGKERILYVPFGDVKSHPEEVMKRVEQHIGIEKYDSYPRLRDKINKTGSENIVITEQTIQRMRELVDGESDFLRNHFGEDFLNRTL